MGEEGELGELSFVFFIARYNVSIVSALSLVTMYVSYIPFKMSARHYCSRCESMPASSASCRITHPMCLSSIF